MRILKITQLNRIDTKYNSNDIELEVEGLDLSFIQDLTPLEIIQNCNDVEQLFKELIEEDLLHKYLQEAGYIISK
jgi:hypothetical protein